jgi:hypothetical protein
MDSSTNKTCAAQSFFQGSRQLEVVDLALGPDLTGSALVTSDLLLHFSRMPKLRHLQLHTLPSDQLRLFEVVREQNDMPFRNLKMITLNVSVQHMASVFPPFCVQGSTSLT